MASGRDGQPAGAGLPPRSRPCTEAIPGPRFAATRRGFMAAGLLIAAALTAAWRWRWSAGPGPELAPRGWREARHWRKV